MNTISIPLADRAGFKIIPVAHNKMEITVNGLYLVYDWDITADMLTNHEDPLMRTFEESHLRGTYAAAVDKFVSVMVAWSEDAGSWVLEICFVSDEIALHSYNKDILDKAMTMILEWHREFMEFES